MKISTNYIFPSIPLRDFDWIAYIEGEEELNINGFGKTEKEAISNLIEQLNESEYGII